VKGSYEADQLGKEIMPSDKAIPLYFGDRVESLRVPMKEPMAIYSFSAPGAAGPAMFAGHIFPWNEKGYVTAGAPWIPGTQANLYSYLSQSFMGWRGGARWWVDNLNMTGARIAQCPISGHWSEYTVDDYLYVKTYPTSTTGTPNAYTTLQQNPRIYGNHDQSAEFPIRSRFLFRPSSLQLTTTLKYCSQGFLFMLNTAFANTYTFWWAAAEDFTPILYLGPQTKWMYSKRAMMISSSGANRPAPV
jgi:hypothetical protein